MGERGAGTAVPASGQNQRSGPVRTGNDGSDECVVAQFARLGALVDPAALATLVGPVERVTRTALVTPGKSGASLERVTVHLRSGEVVPLVLKRTRRGRDAVRWLTGDRVGREAALLAEPRFAGVWDVFACPYRAFAAQRGDAALLMDDLSAFLVPPEDAPLPQGAEDTLLAALAALHARFWASDALQLPWLASPLRTVAMFRADATEVALRAANPELLAWVRQGWAALRAHVSLAVYRLLAQPAEPLTRLCAALPPTLLHGDTRLVNFAFLPGQRVAAFDWQLVSAGPATLDLGFYLIGNARRRSRSPDALIARYRRHLEAALGQPIAEPLWQRMVDAGELYGAALLLWDRALDLDDGSPGATQEWAWWLAQLERLA